MPDALVDEVALVGPRERIAERLEAWRESGVTTLLCATQQDEALELLAERPAASRALRAGRPRRHRHRRRQRDRQADGAGARRAGADLVLCARKAERCEQAAAALRDACARAALRRRRPGQRARSSTARAELGRVDILVNNAGTARGAPPEEMPLAGWQKVVDVNLTGAFLCAQAAGAC